MKNLTLLLMSAIVLMGRADTWTDPETGIEWTFTVTNETASVGGDKATAIPKSTIGDVKIPPILNIYPVIDIGSEAFRGCSGLTRIVMPEGVTNIGEYAFMGCSGLTSVDFEGTPPIGLNNSEINQDAAIRYNVDYADEWLPVIAECGFTNASPYTPPKPDGGPYTEVVDGVAWTFKVVAGNAVVEKRSEVAAIPSSTSGDVVVPSILGGRNVVSIGIYAFYYCTNMTNVTIPEGVTNIDYSAFGNCQKLTNVCVSSSLLLIGNFAFTKCGSLRSVVLPERVAYVGLCAFNQCTGLRDVYIKASICPEFGYNIYGCPFQSCNWDLIMHVPSTWKGRGKTLCGYTVMKDGEEIGTQTVNLTVTNIVVHYIQTSEQSTMTAPITNGVGLVNVIAEVKGGNVAIPETWVSNYPTFKTKFGNDFSAALTKTTGKKDAAGNPMYVWQDYVAGTDPTDETSVFKASVTMVEGKPVVSYTPELTAEEKSKRKYTTWGKVKLKDEKWVEVPSGSEDDYNFFKVTVEMK